MAESDDIARTVRHPLWRIGIWIALVAALVTAALGGFRKAPPPELDPLPAGKAARSALYSVKPLRAGMVTRLPGQLVEGNFLVVEAEVTDLSDGASIAGIELQEDLLATRAPGRPWTTPERVIRADDGTRLSYLVPRVPVLVYTAYAMKPGAPPVDSILLGLQQRVYEATYLQRDKVWLPRGTAAVWTLPVAARLDLPEQSP